MLKQKKSIVVMTKVLVMALLIGVFAAIPSAETFAAANKALRTKVTFNGDKESDEAWMNNNYVMQAGYKKASKIKKNMKMQESKVILYRITAHVRVEMFCVDCISRKRNPRVN